MASDRLFQKNGLVLSHWPTLLFVVGYPMYWLELYCFNTGKGMTTPFSWVFWLIIGVCILLKQIESIKLGFFEYKNSFNGLAIWDKFFLLLFLIIIGFIVAISFLAACHAPYLNQEFDAIHYHITLPRQHLLHHSFAYFSWAADDLFLLPLDFSFAPFWFVAELPNKFPQFICFLGLLAVSYQLVWEKTRHILPSLVVVMAIAGLHGIGIQLGTAMMDIVMVYLFVAALHSWTKAWHVLALIEFSFFLWSKPMVPLFVLTVSTILCVVYWLAKQGGWSTSKVFFDLNSNQHKADNKFLFILFICFGLFIGGPFIGKSLWNAGTPFYPFAPGILKINPQLDTSSAHWHSLTEASRLWTNSEARNSYGIGRGLLEFLQHFWLVAVPAKGVNNAFDYPLGLVFLIFLGPFLYFLINSLRRREMPFIPLLIAIYWLLWWQGTQQSRYLYIPVVLLIIVTTIRLQKFSKIFLCSLLVASSLSAISICRCHKNGLFANSFSLLRERDKNLVLLSQKYIREKRSDVVDVDSHEMAFAQFPVRVTVEKLPHTIVGQ